MKLCHECAIKIRFAFPQKKLADSGEMIYSGKCDNCKRRRGCKEYEFADKDDGNALQE